MLPVSIIPPTRTTKTKLSPWLTAGKARRGRALKRAEAITNYGPNLRRIEDEFDTGTVHIGSNRDVKHIPMRDAENLSGLLKMGNAATTLDKIVNSKPDQVLVQVNVDPLQQPDKGPLSYVELNKKALAGKPGVKTAFAKFRLSNSGGPLGVHYVVSETDLTCSPSVTTHMDPWGKPPSPEMEKAYRLAHPGTIIRHSKEAQQTMSQIPYILSCHVGSTSNLLRRSYGKDLHTYNEFHHILNEVDSLSKGRNPFHLTGQP